MNFCAAVGWGCVLIPLLGRAAGDYNFHPPTVNSPILAVVVDSHTNIWIGGGFTTVGGSNYNGLAVLHPDGSLNTSLTFDLGSVTYGYVASLAVDYADNVYVGYRAYNGGGGVARLNRNLLDNWDLDTQFGSNVTSRIRQLQTLAVGGYPSAHVFVSGAITNSGAWHPLASFNADGSLAGTADLAALGISTSDILQIVYRPDGATIWHGVSYSWPERLLMSGTFGVALGWVDETITYSYPPMDTVFSCAAERDSYQQLTCPAPHGEVLAAGQTAPFYLAGTGLHDNYIGMDLERLGANDSTNYFVPISDRLNHPADLGANIARMSALPDGDLLVVGQFTSIRGQYVNNLAHLLPDGSVDLNFQNYAGFPVLDMARQPDGKYVLVGESNFSPFTGQLMRLEALPSSGVTFNSQPQGQTVYQSDPVSLSASVSAWPGFTGQWSKDGTPLSGQTNLSLYVTAATTNDSGVYQLTAQNISYCPVTVVSSNAVLTVLPAPPAPPNDMFANAIPLAGLAAVGHGTIRSATLEAGETNNPAEYSGRSVWWTWTAPFTGPALLDLSGCDFAAVLGVFTGADVAHLTVVTNNYDYGINCECAGLLTNFSFQVRAGVTYRIAVGGVPNVGTLGDIQFSISAAGSVWTPANAITSATLWSVAASNGRLVAVGDNGTILTSSDAAQWSMASSPISTTLWGLASGNGMFIAVGANGAIVSSTNGQDWTQQTSGTAASLSGIAFGNGLFVAVGASDLVLTSTNGTNWVAGSTGTGSYLVGVAFANGLFFAETPGAALCSTDAVHWASGSVSVSDYFSTTVYGNNRFLSAGQYGAIISSADGSNWVQTATGPGFAGAAFGSGRFVVVGANAVLELSRDGTNWVHESIGSVGNLNAITALGNDRFVAVGSQGWILVSQLPHMGPFALLADGTFQFGLTGLSGSTAIIQATSSLNPPDWQNIATNVVANGMAIFSDPNPRPPRYYRGWLLP